MGVGVIIGYIIFLVICVGIGYIIFRIRRTMYRGQQTMLNKVGLGGSSVTKAVNQGMENMALGRLLEQNPNLTEQYIKDTLYNYSLQIIHKQTNPMFSEKVVGSMQSDSKLDMMATMQFLRVNVLNYVNGIVYAVTMYTDGRDEYKLFMTCNINPNGLYVDSYSTAKGDVVGV